MLQKVLWVPYYGYSKFILVVVFVTFLGVKFVGSKFLSNMRYEQVIDGEFRLERLYCMLQKASLVVPRIDRWAQFAPVSGPGAGPPKGGGRSRGSGGCSRGLSGTYLG